MTASVIALLGMVSLVPAAAVAADQSAAGPGTAGGPTGQVVVDPENPDYSSRVEDVVVTGVASRPLSAPAQASLNATQPQSIIERRAIDQFIPVTADYTQIVNLSPSVSGTSFNGPGLGEAKSTLRGFKDGEYNITYDGIPWGDANGPTHHSTSFFPSSTIGAVIVDRGPGEASQLGQASFGGSINLFSPEVSHSRGGSQSVTLGSWNTQALVTKLNTGDIDALHGARILFNFQELWTDGALTHNDAMANNQMVRAVLPLNNNWELTLFGAFNYTRIHTNDNAGATLAQVALYGKNFALTSDPTLPTYYGYNRVEKHTYFNYARLAGDLTSTLHLQDTFYSYYYKNDTNSALDVTLTPADIAARRGLSVTPVPGGPAIANGHIPGYQKLNVYRIWGDTLNLTQQLSMGELRAGVWFEHSDTGPRARYDYDATTGAPDYRQRVLPGVSQTVEYLQYSGWNQVEPFIDVQFDITPQLTITPGIKYVHFDLHVDSEVNQKSRQPFHGGKTFEKTLYFLTARYALQDNWSVYAQYATGFLVPDVSTTQVVKPNLSNLDPQTSTNYQFGTVFHGDRLSMDADFYYIDFNNKLQTVFNATTGETESFNLGGAVYRGIEGQITYQATDDVFVFANGSLNEAETKGNTRLGVIGGRQIANAPTSTAAVGVLYNAPNGLTISFVDKYVGETWAAEAEPSAYHIDAYTSADLTATWTFDRYRIEAAGYNIFDSQEITAIKPGKTVPYDQYYFQPERNFQVSLKVNF